MRAFLLYGPWTEGGTGHGQSQIEEMVRSQA